MGKPQKPDQTERSYYEQQIENLKSRNQELADLLESARAIADRHGEDTAWDRFDKRLEKAGIGKVTPRTFRVLASDTKPTTKRRS